MLLRRNTLGLDRVRNLVEEDLPALKSQARPTKVTAGGEQAAEPLRTTVRSASKPRRREETPPAQWTLSRHQVRSHFNTLAAADAQPERTRRAKTHLTHHFFGDLNRQGLAKNLHPNIRHVMQRHYGENLADSHVRDAVAHLHAGSTSKNGKTHNDLHALAHQLKRNAEAGEHSYDRNDVANHIARSLDLTLGSIRGKRRVERFGRADTEGKPRPTGSRGISRGESERRLQQTFPEKLKRRAGKVAGWHPPTQPDVFGRTRAVPHTTARPEAQEPERRGEKDEETEAHRKKIRDRLNYHWEQAPDEHKPALRTWIDGLKSGRFSAQSGGRGQSHTGEGGANATIRAKHGISKGYASKIVSKYRQRIACDPELADLHKHIPGLRHAGSKCEESVGSPCNLVEAMVRFAFGPLRARTLLVLEGILVRA